MTSNAVTLNDYHTRINRVLHYINNHLNEELNLNTLAEISNFSPFHFHRLIKAYLNEPLGSYIQRIRLDTGAKLVTYTDLSLDEIAFKTGYETLSSFSKAFKKRFGISPNEYRKDNVAMNTIADYVVPDLPDFEMKLEPKIKVLKPKKVIYVQTKGYIGNNIGQSWEKLWGFVKTNRLFHFNMEAIGIGLDDPKITDVEDCRYCACITITKDIKPNGEMNVMEIAGGKYAIFRMKGSYEHLDHAYISIYRHWLTASKNELRDVPNFECYLNNPGKTKPEKLVTDIYIPVV